MSHLSHGKYFFITDIWFPYSFPVWGGHQARVQSLKQAEAMGVIPIYYLRMVEYHKERCWKVNKKEIKSLINVYSKRIDILILT